VYTDMSRSLDDCFPYDGNYWDKGVFIDWDPNDEDAVQKIVDAVVNAWAHKPAFASKVSTVISVSVVSRPGDAASRKGIFMELVDPHGRRLYDRHGAPSLRPDGKQRPA
jgi:hypothetical protein